MGPTTIVPVGLVQGLQIVVAAVRLRIEIVFAEVVVHSRFDDPPTVTVVGDPVNEVTFGGTPMNCPEKEPPLKLPPDTEALCPKAEAVSVRISKIRIIVPGPYA